jgi:hypothetical protein
VESMYMIGNITVENNLLNAYDVRWDGYYLCS